MGSYDNGNYSGLGYIDPSDVSAKNLKQFKSHFYQSHYTANGVYWQQAAIDKRFKVGDQTLWSMIYGDSQYFQSRRFFFNLIRRHVNMICGYQRRNRKSTLTMPNQENDALADDFNAVIKWAEERDGFQEYFSQAFENAMDVGSCLLELYPDYTLDPISGDLFTDQVSIFNYIIDSNYRKQDLSDCQGIWRRRWVNKVQAQALLPGHAKEIKKMMPSSMKDGRFPLQAELINLDIKNLFPYDEFHYRTTREAKIILDVKTGEAVEWEDYSDEDPEMLDRVLAQQPWLKVQRKQIPTVKLCISLGDRVMYDGPNLLSLDTFNMVPLLCYHEPDLQALAWRQQGIVRNLRDAQYLYNRRKVIELDILESQINSGWIYPIDAVVDPKAFRQSGPGFLVPLKAGHTAAELQRIDAPSIPQSMIELSQSLAEDITKISGVNEELLGAATDDVAGVISALRQAAGITTLQTVFDKADFSQRLFGKIRLQAIRKNFSKGKVRNILGHDPDPRFWTSHSQKYNVVVEEGIYSTTQRQTELQQLIYFKERLGMPIPDASILKAAFITNKKEIIDQMQQQNEQQAQAQQQQAQSEEKRQNADVISKYAKARVDIAKEKETLASAEEKMARVNEINSTAEHKKVQADFDLVKMMIGLEDMDMANFRASFEMAEAIRMAQNPQITNPTGELQ